MATFTDLDNYNFWLRHYDAVSGVWSEAKNLSNIHDPKVHAKEPRLVGTPGNGPGCTDPANITQPENCQDKSTFIVAWGTESNVYAHIGGSIEGDIHYTRTRDKGETFEPAVLVRGIGDNQRFESQLRPTPAGNIVYSVWNEKATDGLHAMASVSQGDGPTDPTDTDGDGIADSLDNCILEPNGPTIPDAGGNIQLDTDSDSYGT